MAFNIVFWTCLKPLFSKSYCFISLAVILFWYGKEGIFIDMEKLGPKQFFTQRALLVTQFLGEKKDVSPNECRCGMFPYKNYTINLFKESIKTKTEKTLVIGICSSWDIYTSEIKIKSFALT